MLSPRHQQQLTRLRTFRAPAARDLSLRGVMDGQAADLKRLARGIGPVATAWAQIAPPGLAERVSLVGVSRGTLTLRAADSAASFELDRFLRGGGERELIRRSPIALRRVKVVV